MSTAIEASADVDDSVTLGQGTRVWHLAQIRDNAVLGEHCVIGRGAYVGSGVTVGDNCKIQNYALVYEPATLARGVFIGPAAVLTNDEYPRAVNVDFTPKDATQWQPVGVTIGQGASIGARAVCVAPLTIGPWAMVAAGAVVTNDVPAYALVAGVPAKRIRWVGESGVPLTRDDATFDWVCPVTADRYLETDDELLVKKLPDPGAQQ